MKSIGVKLEGLVENLLSIKRGRKGVEEFIGVMIVVLIISVFATFLFLINFSSSRENIDVLGKTFVEFESKDVLNSFYGLEYPVPDEDNRELIYAIRYGCSYGIDKSGKFIVSRTVPIVFDPKLLTEKYLDGKIGTSYYLFGNCTKNSIEYGRKPPKNVEIISEKLMFPDPAGRYNEFILQRWI